MSDNAHFASGALDFLGPILRMGEDSFMRALSCLRLTDPEVEARLVAQFEALGEAVLQRFADPASDEHAMPLPRSDSRFADPAWREQPFFAFLHQAYLLVCEQAMALIDDAQGLEAGEKARLRFFARMLLDALSPANLPFTNPAVLARAAETGGESLARGKDHFLADLARGQLTHSDPDAFRVGENLAITPGKVVHETPLYQLIHYAPATSRVLAVPLVIFPPWINRFYILDLDAGKSFVRWAVEQGLSVFMVSWKSADASMADVDWDDYIAAQIDAVDTIRARLKVPSVHAIGYCVAGTTLAATLAVLARRGDAGKVASATFLTAQVDFAEPGDLGHFIGDGWIEAIARLSPEGYLDGRYMAAVFNLLRSRELMWGYAVRHYLLGEPWRAFDLLHWNGDVTNLPAKWLGDYLRDLYRDNLLVRPDALSALGVPIDLGRIETPCFIHAAREDHIAPPHSVWKLTRQLMAPWKFVLAGSGHIAGVVNPPVAGKYRHWVNDAPGGTLDEFIAGATERPGSWWPCWFDWLKERDAREVAVRGRRGPGGRGDRVIEDAPGRYVLMR